ncbi:hypothetical protein BS17DRAFT_787726 [Gyrodon lividus]|nr:hypothetical protein BS17DRAFT_787726 [Gyrodon lividus]
MLVELDAHKIDCDISRVMFIYDVLWDAIPHGLCYAVWCPDIWDQWLQMLEGDDSEDDIWLWVDGDKDWTGTM